MTNFDFERFSILYMISKTVSIPVFCCFFQGFKVRNFFSHIIKASKSRVISLSFSVTVLPFAAFFHVEAF